MPSVSGSTASSTSTYRFTTQVHRLQPRENVSSSSPLVKVLFALGLILAIVILSIFILVIMRMKQQTPNQCEGPSFTFRSLFSRRSKRIPRRISSKRRSSTSIIFPSSTNPSRNDSTTSTSTSPSRTIRANGLRLNKELEVLGLFAHPANVNSPVFLDTVSSRTTAPTPASHSPPTFPVARLHEEPWWASQEEEEQDTLPSRSRHDYPPSPLLPPPPSQSLPPAAQSQSQLPLRLLPPFNATKPVPLPAPAAEDITPPSPAFTFATRSSGIFPWGAEPTFTDASLDDTLSEEVLVLPSPPRFVTSYRYLPPGLKV
ncbi:hypothetical protein BDV06DRAFT_3395 [Aspergillus oleicola]